jgi:putative tryptophan/tyrosine transport system substrate-binding protein
MLGIRRRDFFILLGGAAAGWPLAVRPQPAAMPVIGILNSISFGPIGDRLDAFLERLGDEGFVDGKNLTIEYRSAEGRAQLIPDLAADLVSRNPRAIVCLTSASTVRGAKAATSQIPIVFAVTGDPLELGLVANLDHPEANVTGAGRRAEELNPERLKVISEFVPPPHAIAFLLNSDVATAAVANTMIERMEATARDLGRRLVVVDLAGQKELAAVFDRMARQDVGGFVISTEALFTVWRDEVIALSAHYEIAAIFPNREYAAAGALISFGADLYEHYRIAGTYTARILKGALPADLPVQIPTKFETVINLNTAKAMRLTVPPALLATASELIE